MWDRPDLLMPIANFLYACAAVLVLYALLFTVLHLPVFALREVKVTGRIAHVTRAQVESVVNGQLAGNFFTVDLERSRAAFEKLPWVRKVNVRRQWPDRLEVAVEEHEALARWSAGGLVNTFGERFEAATDRVLPLFAGPQGSSVEVAGRYAEFREILAPLQRTPQEVRLSERRAWQLRLDDRTLLELGRVDMSNRLQRFARAFPRALATLPPAPAHVDLRYSNGFAVRLPGLAWSAGESKGA